MDEEGRMTYQRDERDQVELERLEPYSLRRGYGRRRHRLDLGQMQG